MPAFRTLALVILAAFVVLIFILGYQFLQGLDRERGARDAALELNQGILTTITYGDNRTVEIIIPPGYELRFENQRLSINGFTLPENEYPLPLVGHTLGEGFHRLIIKIRDNSVVVGE
ncbi:MAG: hypothetical protein OEX16_01000 [Hadesarchaea archaeon]|nr:hypothetical protein [Hadesarchaea archaeon]